MAFTLINSAVPTTGTSASCTTAAMNTVGANLIVLSCSYQSGVAMTISDSSGNIWTPLTGAGTEENQLYFCVNPITSASHTFTLAGTASYPGIVAAAFSTGSNTTIAVFDLQNGTASSNTPGSITPSSANELVVSGFNPDATGTVGISTGGWTTAVFNQVNGQTYGVGLGWQIQTTATAANPTWTPTEVGANGCTIACFKAVSNVLLASGLGWTVASGAKNGNNAAQADGSNYLSGTTLQIGGQARCLSIAVKMAATATECDIFVEGTATEMFGILGYAPSGNDDWYGWTSNYGVQGTSGPDGSWHVITYTWDGSSNLKIYVDGVLNQTYTNASMEVNTNASDVVYVGGPSQGYVPSGTQFGDLVWFGGIPTNLSGMMAAMVAKWGSGATTFNPNSYGAVLGWWDPNQNVATSGGKITTWQNANGVAWTASVSDKLAVHDASTQGANRTTTVSDKLALNTPAVTALAARGVTPTSQKIAMHDGVTVNQIPYHYVQISDNLAVNTPAVTSVAVHQASVSDKLAINNPAGTAQAARGATVSDKLALNNPAVGLVYSHSTTVSDNLAVNDSVAVVGPRQTTASDNVGWHDPAPTVVQAVGATAWTQSVSDNLALHDQGPTVAQIHAIGTETVVQVSGVGLSPDVTGNYVYTYQPGYNPDFVNPWTWQRTDGQYVIQYSYVDNAWEIHQVGSPSELFELDSPIVTGTYSPINGSGSPVATNEVQDSLALHDLVIVVGPRQSSASDNLALYDSAFASVARRVSINDHLGIRDLVTVAVQHAIALTDELEINDAASGATARGMTASDSLGWHDTTTMAGGASLYYYRLLLGN